MPELEIIGVPQSNFVWVTRIACTEKSVPYILTPARPHTEEVNAIHPFGKIPVMRHGDFTLCESLAICSYIDRVFDGPSLIPSDPRAAGRVEQWCSLLVTTIDPVLIRRYLIGYLFPGTPDGSPNRPVIDAALPELRRHLEIVERAVASGYLAGDRFTLADAYLLPILYYLPRGPEAASIIEQSAPLSAYLARHLEHPSVRATIPPPISELRQ
jgi:glutathione S-transferase